MKSKSLKVKKSKSYRLQFCILHFTFCILFSNLARGAGGDAGQYGAFLTYWGCGARSLGMVGALSGLADDVEAVYFNPAGLVQLNTHELSFMHSVLFAGTGTSFDALTYGCPVSASSALGTSLLQLYTPGIGLGKTGIKYTDRQVGWLLSYSRKLFGSLCVGGNAKIFYHSIAEWNGLGWGMDFGFLLFPNSKFSYGLNVQNVIKPGIKLASQRVTFPTVLNTGLSLRPYGDRFLLGIDMLWSEYRKPTFGFGLEYKPFSILHLRAGVNQAVAGFGFGVCKDQIRYIARIDYACVLPYSTGGGFLPAHNLSLSLTFGGYRARARSTTIAFSPISGEGENVAWLYLDIAPKTKVKRWQVLIKDETGTVVRKIGAWGEPPYRISWDGKDDNALLVPDGRYYYTLQVVEKTGKSWVADGFLSTLSTVGPPGTVIVKPKGEAPEFILEHREEQKKQLPEKKSEKGE
ncbi:MAG: FlgD immunoglobulin-like domain containing protein [bacterium]|nr:FlgD immunoglobulin-like domain containing protein [bacterium]